jgi:pyrophosphatase PpaX
MRSALPPRPVLFDLDGTLADTIPLLVASMRAAYAACGGEPPGEREWLSGMGRPLRSQLADFEGNDPVRIEALATAYREWQLTHLTEFVKPFADMRILLDALHARGHPVAVVTGKGSPMARTTLEFVGLMDAVPLLVGAEQTQRHKPEAEPLLHACARLGVEPARAVYVGDAPNDVLAARAAGMVDIWVAWGPFSLADLAPLAPTHVAYMPADVIELLDLLDAEERATTVGA